MFGGEISVTNASIMQARKDRRGKRAELPTEISKKLKSCSILNCEDWRDLSEFTTYHCFPTGDKNQDRWEIWTHLLRKAREDDAWIPFRGSLVCSHHFRPADFVNDPLSKRRKLIKNAIPSIFPSFTVDLNDPAIVAASNVDGGDAEGEVDEYAEYEDNCYNDNDNSNGYLYDEDNQPVSQNEYQEEYGADDANELFQPEIHYEEETDRDNEVQMPKNKVRASQSMITQFGSQTSVFKSRTSISNSFNGSKTSALNMAPSTSSSGFRGASQLPKSKVLQNNGSKKVIAARQSWPGRESNTAHQYQSSSSTNRRPKVVHSMKQTHSIQQQHKIESSDEEAHNSIPFPLYINPDLEIEPVESEEDHAVCKQRINELEQEKQSLMITYENTLRSAKEKYERQILILRKRIREQDALMQNNKITSGGMTVKKVRLL